MTTVAALFGTQAEATAAIDALAETPFAEADVRVIEQATQDEAEPDVGAIPHLETSRMSGVLEPGRGDWLEELDDETLDLYLLEGVRRGGVLVVAKVDEDDAEELENFLRQMGGRTPS